MARHHVLLFSAFAADASAPEWVHLVPAGTFSGADGRGPYELADAAGVIAHSLNGGAKLPIDENHAIDLAAPQGRPSPARGWIVALEMRADGIWGRVEWTEAGKSLLNDRTYRGISPALEIHKATGRVVGVLRASLTNTPNLSALTTLHHRSDPTMDPIALRKALGLASDASEADVLAAIQANATAVATHAAQSAAIAESLGLAATAGHEAIVTTLQARAAGAGDAAALRATVVELQTSLSALQANAARETAERVIDAAIIAGKVGLKPLRDHYITRHMADPEGVAKEIAVMPSLHSGGLREVPQPGGSGLAGLSAADRHVCTLMGLDPVAYEKTRKGHTQEAL